MFARMAICRPTINLIKLSLRVGHIPNALQGIKNLHDCDKYKWCIECDRTASFYFRCPNSSQVLQFFYNGHINVTNISRDSDIPDAVSRVCSLIGIPSHLRESVSHTVDNVHASGRVNLDTGVWNLMELSHALNRIKKQYWIDRVTFETSKFPAIIVKFTNAFNNPTLSGTALIFNSKKFIFVGLRGVQYVSGCHDWLESTLHAASSFNFQESAGAE